MIAVERGGKIALKNVKFIKFFFHFIENTSLIIMFFFFFFRLYIRTRVKARNNLNYKFHREKNSPIPTISGLPSALMGSRIIRIRIFGRNVFSKNLKFNDLFCWWKQTFDFSFFCDYYLEKKKTRRNHDRKNKDLALSARL